MLNYDYQIVKLTEAFYSAYPVPPYDELMKKHGRAYSCLLVETHTDYYICIPYRSEIRHKYAYKFKKSKRSLMHKSGLDYTKIVIINKNDYLDDKAAIIDKDEYRETVVSINKICDEAVGFVEDYIGHMTGKKKIHEREFARRYEYSTLKYFHSELGIAEKI